jgi:hypothetical protein
MQLTYPLAMAVGQDAGNRSMRAAGRTRWSDEDYNVAAAQFARAYGPMCRNPAACDGKGYCPLDPTCGE